MKHLAIQKRSNMNKVFKVVLAVFLMVTLFLVSTGPVFAAADATLPGAAPVTYRPLGNTYATKPAYSWAKQGTTATYRLEVYDIATKVTIIKATVKSTSCKVATNLCSYISTKALTNNKSYKWRVAAGKGPFSAYKTFKVLPGFSSQFNGSVAGWIARTGVWSLSGGTSIHTNGVANKWSNISYNANFDNFTYSAKMKRVSATGGSSGFWVRGKTPTFNATYNAVNNAYLFLYSQNGCFSVWKHVGGAVIAKKAWTLSPSIIKNNWNTLKVIADGSVLRFYINNALVWTGVDTSFTTGQVALTMFSISTSERLDVDWATLGMSELYKTASLGVVSETVEQGQVEISPDSSQPYGPEQAPAVP
jgi:hypothetical protein